MPGQHALLSPSSSHRWLHCPAAPRLEEHEPETTSAFAEEGTLAHAIAARKLKEAIGHDTMAEEAEIAALAPSYYEPVMEEHTDTYVDMVLECYLAARRADESTALMVEERLEFAPFVPESFGTSDAIVVGNGELDVFDFKYGKGVEVSAEHNPQMMIYAIGALALCQRRGIEVNHVSMCIVQPRIGNVSTFDMGVDDLMYWGRGVLYPAAHLAYSGEGAQCPGDWCRFCKVKARCTALARYCAEKSGVTAGLLTPAQLAAEVLPRLATIRQWLESVEEYALDAALKGVEFPGFKVVEGTSRRRIVDADAAADALCRAGMAEADIYKPREICNITDLEKRLGRKRFAEIIGPYIGKAKGAPKLAPDSDKRPLFFSAANDFAGIQD